jgi:serine/threonine protein kinase
MGACPHCGAARALGGDTPLCPVCLLQLGLAEPSVPNAARGKDDRLESFRIVALLGQGPAGRVYFAESAAGCYASVKVVDTAGDRGRLIERIRRTASTLSALDGLSAARILQVGSTAEGRLFMVSNYASGVPITDACERLALSLDARVGVLIDLCVDLADAHDRGVAHGAIKPANVLLNTAAGRPAPTLLDLGSAAAMADACGPDLLRRWPADTRCYIAPERLAPWRAVMPSSDVYALGVLLARLAAGDARARASLSRELARIIDRACHANPALRYSTAADLAADLAEYRQARESEERSS